MPIRETYITINAAQSYLAPSDVEVVLYHSPCNDGFAAAMCAYLALGDKAEYIPFNPNAPFDVSKLQNKNVLMVDAAFKPDALKAARYVAKKVLILDHHMPSQKGLEDIEGCCFAPNNSGGPLSWYYFNGLDATLSRFLENIQKQDLRIGTTPESDAVAAALRTLRGDKLYIEYANFQNDAALDILIQKGNGILEANRQWCAEMAPKAQLCNFKPTADDALTAMCLQLDPAKMLEVTDLGDLIWKNLGSNADEVQMVVFWAKKPGVENEITLSFRSKLAQGGIDVAELAKKFGGGGHKEAAGAAMKNPPSDLIELLPVKLSVAATDAPDVLKGPQLRP